MEVSSARAQTSDTPSLNEDIQTLWQDLNRQKQIIETLLNLLMTPTFNSENFSILYQELIKQQQALEQKITDLESLLTDTTNNYNAIKKDLQNAKDYSEKLKKSIAEISTSFNDYKLEAKKQLDNLSFWNDVLKWSTIVLGAIAIGEGVYIAWPK